MLTQTSEDAIRALIHLSLIKSKRPVTPREIAESLDASPTYMAKITRQLVKANILRSHRGAAGGVSLVRPADKITLLAIIEACQGLIVSHYCDTLQNHEEPVCAFHKAMQEAHFTMMGILTKWTLADLVGNLGPTSEAPRDAFSCRMSGLGCCDSENCDKRRPLNGLAPKPARSGASHR